MEVVMNESPVSHPIRRYRSSRTMFRAPRGVLTVVLLLILAIGAEAGGKDEHYDWPHWRGPTRDGISQETEWDPEALSGGPRLLWHAEVGAGYSNVAIQDGHL
jgi:hypothetical protein